MTISISNKPRKLPAQRRAHSTFEAVLEATARILEEVDASHASTNAIAERAGVSIGSLYQYFPSREAIYAEMIRRSRLRMLDRMRLALDRAAAESTADATVIHELVVAAVDQQLERPDVARVLDRVEPALMLGAETQAMEAQIAGLLAGWLDTLSTERGPHRDSRTVQDVIALVKGMVDAAGMAGETDRKSLAERTSRAVCGYLGIAARRT
jgi:AcrR family transcriptional regulator